MQETKSRTILYTLLICFAMGGLVWVSLGRRAVTVDGGYRMTMGTFTRIVAVAQNRRQARDAIGSDLSVAVYDPR